MVLHGRTAATAQGAVPGWLRPRQASDERSLGIQHLLSLVAFALGTMQIIGCAPTQVKDFYRCRNMGAPLKGFATTGDKAEEKMHRGRKGGRTGLDDRDLLLKARDDPDAFGAFFRRHYDRIYAYAYRRTGHVHDAEEIAAATFQGALRSLPAYRPEQAPAAAWLYRIAARKVADHYRRRPPCPPAPLAAAAAVAAPDTDPAAAAEAAEQAALVQRALGRLRPADRQAVDLAYFLAASRAEMGAILGCTPENAALRLHRALKRLGKEMELLGGGRT